MSGDDGTSGWAGIIAAAGKGPLTLLALILLVLGAGVWQTIATLYGPDRTVLLGGFLLILLLVVIFAGLTLLRRSTAPPTEVKTIWSKEDLPIPSAIANSWIGRWTCRWSYRTGEGRLAPYVDDVVDFEDVQKENGFIHGKGHSAYKQGVTYKVSGRISKSGFGVFYYSSATTEFVGLDGTFILRMNPFGKVTGWWLGNARDGKEIQGHVTLSRPVPGETFEFKAHAYPAPPADGGVEGREG